MNENLVEEKTGEDTQVELQETEERVVEEGERAEGARGKPDHEQAYRREQREHKETKQQLAELQRQVEMLSQREPVPETAKAAPSPRWKSSLDLMRQNPLYADLADELEKTLSTRETTQAQIEKFERMQQEQMEWQRISGVMNEAARGVDIEDFRDVEHGDKVLGFINAVILASLNANDRPAEPGMVRNDMTRLIKTIMDFTKAYHQKELKKEQNKKESALGRTPERGSGASVRITKTLPETTPDKIEAEAAKRGISVQSVIEERAEKILAAQKKELNEEE